MIGTLSARIPSASKRTVVVYALLAAALLGAASGASAQTGRPALQFTAATGYGNGGFPVLGWSFTTTQAVTVSALTAQNPHLGSSVRLYDGAGNVLASAAVTPSDPLNGTPVAFRAHAITPILLAASTTYYIVQEAAVFGFQGQATGVTTIPAITFGAMISSGTAGANPTTDELFGLTYNPGAFGPSFETPTPTIDKSFGLPTITVGGTTSLTFVLTNPDPFLAMSGIGFTDTLPAGLVVASPNSLTGSCGGGTIGAAAGSSSVTLAGATLTAGASCTFSVNVTATTPGSKVNSVAVTSTSAGTGNTATASLMVLGGATVTPTAGLVTTEGGGTATFTVVLTGQPTANVQVGLSSSDTTEGTVAPPSLTFTNANWNVAQTVTVTGVDDVMDDGNIAYTIETAPAISADTAFSGLDAVDVAVTNTDNDTAGITVTPTSGLVTTEAGGTATFTVVLTSQPTGGVIIAISSSNSAEGTVPAPLSLLFTPATWSLPQTVTVTGVDDAVDDGNVAYTVVTGAAFSGDANYSGLNPSDVAVTNTDNDSAAITVSPTAGLTTTEAGGTATFSVVLASQPTASVVVGVSSSNTAEGTVSVPSLTFTAATWNVPQTVTITGVDEFVDDGNIAYTVVIPAATSTDPNYSGLNPTDVSLTNTDDDTAGITVTPTSGLVTTEAGGTATFTMVLTAQPSANVVVGLSSSNTGEGTVGVAQVTFTSANWNVPQTVTVTGVDDFLAEGDVGYSIITAAATSTDTAFNGLNAADISVANTNDDVAGVTVTPTSGLVTTEAGGTATFSMVLTAQPSDAVIINVSSSDTTEGTLSSSALTFTPANWNVPQTVTVTGVDDNQIDGNVPYTIVTSNTNSGVSDYDNRPVADVSVTNVDNDTAGITVTPTSGLVTTEAGGTATFTVVLTSQPTGGVIIALSSSNSAEGTVPALLSLTFNPATWNLPQTVTVTGVDDALDDGNVAYTVVTGAALSGDANYNGLNPSDAAVTNTDNDSAAITVSPTAGLTTTEAGGTATFSVVLASQPTADVTIGLATGDLSEGTVPPGGLTFTALTWNVPQTVTVTGVDDAVDDGDVAFAIVTNAAVSTDPNYSGLDAADVSVTNTDNDTAGITVSPTSGLTTTEAGGVAPFIVTLTSQPLANVTVGLSSSDATEGSVAPLSLTFTAATWNVPQTVTVTGADDALVDGNQAYGIVTAAATSSDPNYSGLNPPDVAVTNTDNDTAGVTVSPTSGLVTNETGTTATFTVVLTAQPTANVTIGVSSGDTTEGSVAPGLLTFMPAGWNVPQTVTVTGQPDALTDGNVLFTVQTSVTTSTDAAFHNLPVADVTVTNTEGALPSLSLSKTSSALSFAQVGDVLPYTMVATNTGNVPVSNVIITDPLLPTLACTPTQPATLNPGQTLTCTGSYTVTATDVAAGQVTNVAEASGQTNDGSLVINPQVAQPEALVTVTAQGTVTVPGIAPGVGSTRLALTACTIELQQDWTPRYTKLQFEVWNEDEVKFTGAFECSDSWHETDFGQSIDSAQQNFTIGVLGTYGARYRVQAVTSTQCPDARATGLLGVQSMTIGVGQKSIGATLVGAGKFTGSIRWDPAGAVPEGAIR